MFSVKRLNAVLRAGIFILLAILAYMVVKALGLMFDAIKG